MRTFALVLLCALALAAALSAQDSGLLQSKSDAERLLAHGPNLPTAPSGQKPPGMTPEIFAPGVVSRDGIQMKLTMTGDGSEILKEDLLASQFSGPCFSPDGRTLLMHSRKEGGFGNWDLYVSFKDESGNWSELKNLGPAVNTDKLESSPTFSSDGRSIFFTRDGDIYLVSARVLDELRH